MASTSAFEIGFAAAAETVDVPADAAEALAAVAVDGEGAEVPSPSPRMEKVPVKRPPQLRSRRVWSRKWLIRYFRKRSYFSSWLCTCSQACARFPPSRK